MTLKAMKPGETILKRWSRPLTRGGGKLVLVEGAGGMRLLKQDIMAEDARAYSEITIRVGARANGGPLYSSRVTVEQADRHAEANGYEEAS